MSLLLRSLPAVALRASRTAFCGELSEPDVGRRVRLCGWVALHRVHGGLTFLSLRDHTGIVQVTTLPDDFPEAHSVVNDLRLEYVAAEHVHVLNAVRSKLPFLVTTADDAKDSTKEEIRLRYRCLDLRRPHMSSNIMLRHRVVKLIRRYLEDVHGFVEIETPILSRSTPEGARDYLVPSRIQPGTFYALPQSPQLFKQMLMVSGFDKYYQIARCFRDEDLRADRQPEFTQLDMEMAFTPLEDMLKLNEDLIRKVFREIKGVELPNPFPRLTYSEAMSRYGSDRPDMRFDVELKDVSDVFRNSSFKVFADTLSSGGIIKAICVPSGAKSYSNSALKKGDIYNEAIKSGAKLSADSGDLILFAVGNHASVNKILDRLRLHVAHELGLIDPSKHSILWVTDFPMFEWNDFEERLEALHHPFTAPNPDDMKDLASARALAYDMVYNGVEIGGGSLIFKREVQEKVLEIVGISREQVCMRAESEMGVYCLGGGIQRNYLLEIIEYSSSQDLFENRPICILSELNRAISGEVRNLLLIDGIGRTESSALLITECSIGDESTNCQSADVRHLHKNEQTRPNASASVVLLHTSLTECSHYPKTERAMSVSGVKFITMLLYEVYYTEEIRYNEIAPHLVLNVCWYIDRCKRVFSSNAARKSTLDYTGYETVLMEYGSSQIVMAPKMPKL
ncbi:UNVERIFIED_CONTAM: Aspartate--tRNA ligase, chloroplastic/mitochondrial [Sesamum calycinum]|uniref:Aspartate--tRNA ligase, chloroplastic/mitochondrial n=1 Tax=Sesamum calycinum TaxID=2727403 RepID=A0AAW2R974_9LAMI